MGVYRYLYCLTCKEYLHLGKAYHSDYEVDYTTFELFLDRHQHYNGCTLVTLCDGAENELFCQMCDGKEFPGEVLKDVSLDEEEKLYKIENIYMVKRFLKTHAFIKPYLLNIYSNLQKYFPNSPIYMSEDYDNLLIEVGSTLSAEESVDLLDKFDKDCWLDNCYRDICIKIRYI